jgi:hypothetical protein
MINGNWRLQNGQALFYSAFLYLRSSVLIVASLPHRWPFWDVIDLTWL